MAYAFARLAFGLVASLVFAAAAPVAQAETRTPYQISTQKTCPNPAVSCELIFPTAAADRRIEIDHINCYLSVPGDELTVFFVRVLPQGVLYYLPVDWKQESGNSYFVNETTSLFASAGSHIRITANSVAGNGSIFLNCALSGTFVFLP